MIFYGTNSSNLKNGVLRNVSCPHCSTNSSMNYTIFGKYFYLYWIPVFPIGRVNIVECNHCKATYDIKDLDQTVKNKFQQDQERNPIKTPLKLFSGLIIGAVITVAVIGFGLKGDNDSAEFAKNPKVGDVYYYEIPEMKGHFSTMKITQISKDTIFIMGNNMEIDLKSDIDKILDDKNYTYPDKYSKVELRDLTKNLSIFYKIERK
ncbi:zinc-ribbon domain-containing protein [Flavobacterium sp.]|uniref:zinc-ribbon domain-containing protein n=1 Tax=Flavobacterium sp. TaxID=239 RepID=UPI00286E3358|nr:zinc-ribbon domain-containing protein [Flavobacterium sp.]